MQKHHPPSSGFRFQVSGLKTNLKLESPNQRNTVLRPPSSSSAFSFQVFGWLATGRARSQNVGAVWKNPARQGRASPAGLDCRNRDSHQRREQSVKRKSMNTSSADPQGEDKNGMNEGRRRFLQSGLAAAGAVLAEPILRSTAFAELAPLEMTETGPDSIPRKPLGKTGEHVSIIGLGGYHLGTMGSLKSAIRLVQEAVDAGVNFCDNA
ncbi:MAG: hypothetical protein ABSH48_22725 [Verrucomicrobiota bacterium]